MESGANLTFSIKAPKILIEMTTEAAQVFSSVRRSNSGCPRVRVCLATQRVEYGPEGRKGGLEVAPSVRRWVHGADVGKWRFGPHIDVRN